MPAVTQDLTISDGTQYIKLTLWEAEVQLKKYQCYRLSNLLIREFRGEKYITTRKKASKIEDIPDMTNVTNEEYPETGSISENYWSRVSKFIQILH